MAGDNDERMSKSAGSLEGFRRSQRRRRLLPTPTDPRQPSGSGSGVLGAHPVDPFLNDCPSGSALPPTSHASSGRETSTSGSSGTPSVPRHATTYREARQVGEGGRRQRPSTSPPRQERAILTAPQDLEPLTRSPQRRQAVGGNSPGPSRLPETAVTPSSAAGHLRAAVSPRAVGSSTAGSSRVVRPPSALGLLSQPSKPQFRRMRLGIETEFYLAAYNWELVADELNKFVKLLALEYNRQANLQHRMHDNLRIPGESDDYSKWSMVREGSIAGPRSPWGVEMRSPILDVYPNSQWRNHVRRCWSFLKRYYRVTGDEHCSTHIHISLVPGFNLTELKRIASSIIYFEEAFEALMPQDRSGNAYAASNWLTSPNLRRKGRSRSQCIEEIGRAFDEVEVFRLIQGFKSHNLSWNFWNLYGKKGTIEFRSPPPSTSVSEALSWAELTMNFIQASLTHGSSMRNFVPNVGGLRSFLEKARVGGVNEPALLQRIWANKPANAARAPHEIDGEVLQGMDEVDTLTEEAAAELRRGAREAWSG